jgi:hypothetical protein
MQVPASESVAWLASPSQRLLASNRGPKKTLVVLFLFSSFSHEDAIQPRLRNCFPCRVPSLQRAIICPKTMKTIAPVQCLSYFRDDSTPLRTEILQQQLPQSQSSYMSLYFGQLHVTVFIGQSAFVSHSSPVEQGTGLLRCKIYRSTSNFHEFHIFFLNRNAFDFPVALFHLTILICHPLLLQLPFQNGVVHVNSGVDQLALLAQPARYSCQVVPTTISIVFTELLAYEI